MKLTSAFLLTTALVVGLLTMSAPCVEACAPVMFKGARVSIASESALIIYDDKTKTEHFIRRGTFETKVPYFGFLVPTPTKPDAIAEAPDSIFSMLQDWTKPEIITETRKRPRDWGMTKSERSFGVKSAPRAGEVAVVGMGQVAGLDYHILKADDAGKLKEWLEIHGYVTRPDLESWLKLYVTNGWFITAFQLAKAENRKDGPGLSTKAVRMTFKTDRPFYPYREPEGQREEGGYKPGRLLRVFYVGNKRVEGKLHGKSIWPGSAVWSNTISDHQKDLLVKNLKDKGDEKTPAMPEKAWLTEFEDFSSPRPGTADLFFSEAAQQTTISRPPIHRIHYIDEDAPAEVNWWRLGAFGVIALLTLLTLGIFLWRMMSGKAAA